MGQSLSKNNWSTEQGCAACGLCHTGMTTLHHLYTRKAKPEFQMKPWNLIPVCQRHHIDFHSRGTVYMSANFAGVFTWLTENDWHIDEFTGKWFNPGAQQ